MSAITNQKFNVTGMSCASCSAHVEKAVRNVTGVTDVAVNLLTNSMIVSYDTPATAALICEAVSKAGYGTASGNSAAGSSSSATIGTASGNSTAGSSSSASMSAARAQLEDHESPLMIKRLVWSLVFLLPLMYVSMGHTMWGWPVPAAMNGNALAIALYEMLLSGIVMIINQKFFVSGFKGLAHGGANMDTLVAMGSAAGFIYSTAIFFLMTNAAAAGDMTRAHELMHSGLYYESSAMILTLITVGKTLEAVSKGKTTNAIKSLMDLAPKTAHVIRDGAEVTIPANEVVSGDTFIVRPGESFPVDGQVTYGESAVDESALTGESLPVDKAPGSNVSAATINRNGALTCTATRVGMDTTLQRIIDMVQDAAATKAPVAKIADKVSGVFVPVVIVIALIDFIIWIFARGDIGFALGRAISVLVISCPCAMGLATPVAIMVGSGLGAKNGILFKTASSLEATGKIKYMILDKTGTLTEGKPEVTDVIPAAGVDSGHLVGIAGALEAMSEHPLATAVRDYAEKANNNNNNSGNSGNGPDQADRQISSTIITNFKALPGHGVSGTLPSGKTVIGGNAALMTENGVVEPISDLSMTDPVSDVTVNMRTRGEELSVEGKTPMYFAEDGKLLGIIAVADVVRSDSHEALGIMARLGIRVMMLTGDNRRTAVAIGKQLGLEEDQIISDVLPDGKAAVVQQVRKSGLTAVVGDGINDAPALTGADVGIAIGAGADVAIDAADVVLMKSSLIDAAGAVRLSRETLRNIHENLFWALFYNALCIPVAAGALIPAFGIVLNPMFGAAAMSLSSLFVVGNALRMNLFDVHSGKHDKRRGFTRASFATRELPPAPDLGLLTACPLPGVKAHSEDDTASMNNTSSSKSITPKENTKMSNLTKEISVTGMMCEHCVAHVKSALEAVDGVTAADVSLADKKAVVTLSHDVNNDALVKAVVDAGYEAEVR